ncbi:MAG TPA: cobalamin biosynthesis protein [Nitrososphaeraceae archaeon]|nr:cobalamin biosynthesis protein [Nitrososphaeraceae archaeon]
MIRKIAVVAITKHGIDIARRIKEKMPEVEIYASAKHSNSTSNINWFTEQTAQLIANLFKTNDALICIFSLGAVMRLIAPFLVDKKSDPAVLVIDDKANFVISALSGHLGGANALARLVASFFLNSQSVITTAADVNETIAVDLVGREFGWAIENYENVTKVSAFMVNEEKMALYQETGEKNWWKELSLPKNVTVVKSLDEIKSLDFKGALIISDRVITEPIILEKSVIYRPKSLVVGLGLHWDTHKDDIESGIKTVMKDKGLSFMSIRNISSINRDGKIKGLQEFSDQYDIPVEIYDKDNLAAVTVPNPSYIVEKFEGTASVSEASSILSSKGEIIIPKQKFPPNLTVSVARAKFD